MIRIHFYTTDQEEDCVSVCAVQCSDDYIMMVVKCSFGRYRLVKIEEKDEEEDEEEEEEEEEEEIRIPLQSLMRCVCVCMHV